MAKLTIPGTTIQYDNPNSLDATAVDPKRCAVGAVSPLSRYDALGRANDVSRSDHAATWNL